MFKNNFNIYLFLFIFLLLVIFVPWIILFSSYESRNESIIALKHLSEEGGKVNFGLLNKEMKYKKEAYKLIQPSVVVIGSSRTNQIKKKFFLENFYNLNRGLNFRPSEVTNEFRFIVENNKNLKVVIWGLDYWHFNSLICTNKYDKERKAINIDNNTIFQSKIIPKQTLEVWKFIFQGKINFNIFFSNLTSPKNRYGLNALYLDKDGYLNDGSYLYEELKIKKLRDEVFEKQSKENIPYQLTNPAQLEICDEFEKKIIIIKDFLKEKNVNLIIYLPPYPELHKNIVQKKNYYQKVLFNLRNGNIDFIDLLNHSWGNVDNEFIDWGHSSEVISARILSDLVKKYPEIKKFLDIQSINRTLQECSRKHYCE